MFLFDTRNYDLFKSMALLLKDCGKDALITKYTEGDLIAVKALIDAGTCYPTNFTGIVPIEKIDDKYYEKRNMVRTNLFKRDLNKD